jgi:hypothetical protein
MDLAVNFVLSAVTLLFFYSGLNEAYAQKDGDDIVIGKYGEFNALGYPFEEVPHVQESSDHRL